MEHQTTATAPLAARPPRRLHRDPEHRLILGVAAGLADHLGIRVAVVRAAFVILLPLNGVGALLYVAFWVVLRDPPGAGLPRRRNIGELLPYVALGAGVLLLWALAGFGGFGNALGWLIAIIAVGAGLIWHLADPDRRRRWSRAVPRAPWMGAFVDENDRRSYLLRFIGGGALVIVGIIGTIAVFAPISGNGFALAPVERPVRAGRADRGVASCWPRCSGGCSASCARSGRAGSGRPSAPSSPRWCTTRCCTRSR